MEKKENIILIEQRNPNKLPRMKRYTTRNPLLRKVAHLLHRLPVAKMPLLSVAWVAENVGVSPAHLTRVVKKNFGFTPKEVLLQIKMVYARRFMFKGYSIKEISEFLDFSSVSYFTKVFKRYYNVTPGKYQEHIEFFKLIHNTDWLRELLTEEDEE